MLMMPKNDISIMYSGTLYPRGGGPGGYLYYLYRGIERIYSGDSHEDISPNFVIREGNKSESGRNRAAAFKRRIKKVIPGPAADFAKLIITKRQLHKNWLLFRGKSAVWENSTALHFHWIPDFYAFLRYSRTADNYLKILMSHTPEAYSSQIITADKAAFPFGTFFFFDRFLKSMENIAFKGADILVFPSEGAMEPYYETMPGFSELIKDKPIYFLPSGIEPALVKRPKQDFRRQYNIPANSFVVGYAGRYEPIKGFDVFVEVAKKLVNEKDIVFVAAGRGYIVPPKLPNLIDVGWTHDTGSLINASDVLAVPNRRCYFDLVLLEALSIGIPVIASTAGGSKDVAKLAEGIYLVRGVNPESWVDAVGRVRALTVSQREYISSANRHAFYKYFTADKFTENYVNLYRTILQSYSDPRVAGLCGRTTLLPQVTTKVTTE